MLKSRWYAAAGERWRSASASAQARRTPTRSACRPASPAMPRPSTAPGATASRSRSTALNAKGGIAGRKIELVVEDNRSEPQEAVDGLSQDDLVRQCEHVRERLRLRRQFRRRAARSCARKSPMVLCSILPQQPDQREMGLHHAAAAAFRGRDAARVPQGRRPQIKKIGVLHDPSPYANAQKAAAEKEANDFGLEIVGNEQYKTGRRRSSVQIGRCMRRGAGAILKIGLGGTTLTAAKNIKQLGLDMMMLTSLEDVTVFRPVAEVLGDKFFFVASPSQVYEALPDGPLKTEIGKFLDPLARQISAIATRTGPARGWDAVMLIAAAVEKAKSPTAPKVRDALETACDDFQGTTGVYHFSAEQPSGITENPLLLGNDHQRPGRSREVTRRRAASRSGRRWRSRHAMGMSRRCGRSTCASARANSSPCSGPNGAGKSTLMRAIMGLVRDRRRGALSRAPTCRGAIRSAPPRCGIVLVPEGRGHLRADDGRGESRARRLSAATTSARFARRARARAVAVPAPEGAPARRSPVRCPAASSRCWRSGAR